MLALSIWCPLISTVFLTFKFMDNEPFTTINGCKKEYSWTVCSGYYMRCRPKMSRHFWDKNYLDWCLNGNQECQKTLKIHLNIKSVYSSIQGNKPKRLQIHTKESLLLRGIVTFIAKDKKVLTSFSNKFAFHFISDQQHQK